MSGYQYPRKFSEIASKCQKQRKVGIEVEKKQFPKNAGSAIGPFLSFQVASFLDTNVPKQGTVPYAPDTLSNLENFRKLGCMV